jgi:hypothetical protein
MEGPDARANAGVFGVRAHHCGVRLIEVVG